MSKKGRTLVIGAGASGLVALKEALHVGLDAVCFEAEPELGGLWRFTEDESNSSVYRSTVINTCKEMMTFSDFPIGREIPPFLHNTQVVAYFHQYADNFKLNQHIRFDTRVERVKPAPGAPNSWEVTYKTKGATESTVEIFEFVMICSGHHWKTRMPTFPGQDKFKGRIIHSHAYKDPAPYVDKHVAVVGIGNSGLDVAVEVSRVSKQTYISTRTGAYIFGRIHRGSEPLDYQNISRFNSNMLPMALTNFVMEHVYSDNESLRRFGILPKHKPLDAHPSINADFFGRAACGAIVTRPNIREIKENSIVYEDGKELPCDEIVMATGYDIGFPFLDDSTGIVVRDNKVELYKYVFAPNNASRPSLAFIGLIQPWGAIMPISEVQSRWATGVFTGKFRLPSESEMRADIKKTAEEMARRYVASPRHTIQVDYVTYTDMIGEFVGCTPRFWPLFLKDPQLAFATFFNGAVPYTYRLMGPDTWKGARRAILDAGKNMLPHNTRTAAVKSRANILRKLISLIIFLLIVRRYLRR